MGIQPATLSRNPLTAAVLVVLLAAPPLSAFAGVADKVYEIKPVAGETEFEFRGGYEDADQGPNPYQAVFDVGYGVSNRWLTELVVKYDATAPGENGKISELEWENIVALTEPGRYWLDLGLFHELSYSRLDNNWELVFAPMFQKTVGREQFNLNVNFERQLVDGADTEVLYRGQWKHRAGSALEYGLQAFGELGPVNHLGRDDQHKLGPALFGAMRAGGNDKFLWNVAVLAGLNAAAPDVSLRFELEYESYR